MWQTMLALGGNKAVLSSPASRSVLISPPSAPRDRLIDWRDQLIAAASASR
jgi:hypothetical protein